VTRAFLRAALGVAALAPLLVGLAYAPALYAPFVVPKFAVLEIAAALGLVTFGLASAGDDAPRLSPGVMLGAGLVVATTLLSSVVARYEGVACPYAADAVCRWLGFFGLALAACVVARAPVERQLVLESVAIAAGTVSALGLLQHVGCLPLGIPVISLPGSTFGNRNIAGEFVAMALPLGLGAARGARSRGSSGAMYGAVAVAALFLAATRARGAWAGGAAGVVFALAAMRTRWAMSTRVAVAALVALACIVAAVPGQWTPHDAGDNKRYGGVALVLEGALDSHSPALRSRLGMWRRTLRMIADAPWVGVGPGNWPVVFPRYAEPHSVDDGVLTATLAPRQAHDDALERAGETGAVGLLALLVLAGATATTIRRRLAEEGDSRIVAAAAGGALVSLVVTGVAGFPLEMPGTLTLGAVALGLVATEGTRAPSRRRGWLVFAVGCLGLVVAILRADRSVTSQRALALAERALHRDHGEAGAREAMLLLNAARQADPRLFLVSLRATQMWLRESQPDAAISAAERALAIEPFSPNARAALAASILASGDAERARAAATDALDMLHDYPYALLVRVRAEGTTHLAAAEQDRQRLSDIASNSPDVDTRRAAKAALGELP
jgi:O-antigen ligase